MVQGMQTTFTSGSKTRECKLSFDVFAHFVSEGVTDRLKWFKFAVIGNISDGGSCFLHFKFSLSLNDHKLPDFWSKYVHRFVQFNELYLTVLTYDVYHHM